MRKIKIPKSELKALYYKKRKSLREIGKMYDCSFSTVANRIRDYGLPLKSPAEARIRYSRKKFSGNSEERAYMIGFRIGDLNVYKPSVRSETVVVRTHTTKRDQVRVMEELFSKYGHTRISISAQGNRFHVNCYLDNSFEFLMPKYLKVPIWIRQNKKCFLAFAAGYIDAEGSFGINQGKARFKVDSYDRGILEDMHEWFSHNGVASKFWRIAKKGQSRGGDITFNDDLWRMNVNTASDIQNFINLVGPFMLHHKRICDMKKAHQNIKERSLRGSIVL